MIHQTPATGTAMIRHCGDCLCFDLQLSPSLRGQAWLRTNLGRIAVRQKEILNYAEKGRAILGRDWHDVPMRPRGDGRWSVRLPLVETGCFRAKAFFSDEVSGKTLWPDGEDVVVKVEPAETVLGNSIYTVFPRQFATVESSGKTVPEAELARLDAQGYTVIPRSGTFRDVIRKLDFIMGDMGFRILQLLPIHPVPTTYARMGRYGSPFASTDFFSVDPALAEFDKRTTPMEQFRELTDAVHARRGRIFIDLPANHTGWASHFQTHHPEWFKRNGNGELKSPGAWGVVWADLCELDYEKRELWREMAEVFLFWCRQGVDGFRCDAGYMVPVEVWTYISAKVRNEFPDCVFMLEGLGGPLEVVQSLLTDGNLNWAYSELFQNYTREEISAYLPKSNHDSETSGTLVHFAETHDNNRLAATSPGYARMRTALCALSAAGGAFGITNGLEWLATEKVDVHGASDLNWGSEDNQVQEIARLLAVLEEHPAFRDGVSQRLVQRNNGQALALLRQGDGKREAVLVLVNLSPADSASVHWASADFPLPESGLWVDLLTGTSVRPSGPGSAFLELSLAPGAVLCLAPSAEFLAMVADHAASSSCQCERALRQRFQALALMICQVVAGTETLADFALDAAVDLLRAEGARAFCQSLLPAESILPIVSWKYPEDARRVVMVPPGQMLLLEADGHFLAQIEDGGSVKQRAFSLPSADGRNFALLRPFPCRRRAKQVALRLSLYGEKERGAISAPLLLLGDGARVGPKLVCPAEALDDGSLYALCCNELGGMAQVRASWGHLESQYDGFLVPNCHPDFPVDRQVMLRRLRGWVVYRDYSQKLDFNCQESFSLDPTGCPVWLFDVPVGQGKTIGLRIRLRLAETGNQVHVFFERLCASGRRHCLEDEAPVKLILRPDLEDRNCHENTQAMRGEEQRFPAATKPESDGFRFNPSGKRCLQLRLENSQFTYEPEWEYMVAQPFEANRGLAPHTDVYSPGYFSGNLHGREALVLRAAVDCELSPDLTIKPPVAGDDRTEVILRRGLEQFIVRRDRYKTVIAGYPWFLDWGRDTLICLRGIAAAGFHAECRDILLQFAHFEKGGTLPNMIRGDDDTNRETSDAPLWFFTACRDYIEASGDRAILEADCGGRTVLEAMVSIAKNYSAGTANGIIVDPDSGLVFSPKHFTWMDTNHPAGTPREGYPIEIQALWHAALANLAEWTGTAAWRKLAKQVRESIAKFYVREDRAFLSDCLHASPGTPAAGAEADDHCRPNQLLAVTLGAVADLELQRGILSSCETLLIPGGIRSLADRRVSLPLPVFRDGVLLNDPGNPYWGRYEGDEDTRRKPAYHNGTAWSWQFPLYPEALFQVYGEGACDVALAILMSSMQLLNSGCLGQLPEILDGDSPHSQRGCGAQAWGISELYRVRKCLLGGKRS